MSALTGLTYDDVATLFKAANLPCSQRHVRGVLATERDDAGKLICPVKDYGYHTKRFRPRDVERLIKHLERRRSPNAKTFDGKPRRKL